jgi:hypothetical protein
LRGGKEIVVELTGATEGRLDDEQIGRVICSVHSGAERHVSLRLFLKRYDVVSKRLRIVFVVKSKLPAHEFEYGLRLGLGSRFRNYLGP